VSICGKGRQFQRHTSALRGLGARSHWRRILLCLKCEDLAMLIVGSSNLRCELTS
jgi:hypothetical protein